MGKIVFQQFLTHCFPVSTGKCARARCLLIPGKIFCGKLHLLFLLPAQVQQQTRIFNGKTAAGTGKLFIRKQWLYAAGFCHRISSALLIFEKNPRFFAVQTDISTPFRHRIGRFARHRRMADDHTRDFRIFTRYMMGKQHICDRFCAVRIFRFFQKSPVQCGVFAVHAAFLDLSCRENLHRRAVALECMAVFFAVFDHVGVDQRFLLACQCVAVGEIHPDDLRKDLVERRIHRFDIVLVQARDADVPLHGFCIPWEIFLPHRAALHHQFADGFEHFIGWKTLIARSQNLIDILIERFHRLCKISGPF